MNNILQGALNRNYPRAGQCETAADYMLAKRAMTDEEIKKAKDLEIAREREYERMNQASAMVQIVEGLVMTHNLRVVDATEKASELFSWAQSFVKDFRLPA